MDLCNHRILRSTNFKHMIPFFLEQEMFPLYRCSFANTIGKVLCRKTTKTQTHTHICSKGVSLPMINHSCVCVGLESGKATEKNTRKPGKGKHFPVFHPSFLPPRPSFVRKDLLQKFALLFLRLSPTVPEAPLCQAQQHFQDVSVVL